MKVKKALKQLELFCRFSENIRKLKNFKTNAAKIASQNGTITDVAGFSQSGGYKKVPPVFDDWGRNQFERLTASKHEQIQNF